MITTLITTSLPPAVPPCVSSSVYCIFSSHMFLLYSPIQCVVESSKINDC